MIAKSPALVTCLCVTLGGCASGVMSSFSTLRQEMDGVKYFDDEARKRFYERTEELFPEADDAVDFLRQQARSEDSGTRVTALYAIAALEWGRHHDPSRQVREACGQNLREVVDLSQATDKAALPRKWRHMLSDATGLAENCLSCLSITLEPGPPDGGGSDEAE
jgi:hypothetical protein